MTTTSKTVLGIGILAVVILIGIYAYRTHNTNTVPAYSDSNLPTSASDTSDAALAKDSAAIDTQLNSTNDDSATVDQGIQTHAAAQ